MQRRLRTTLLQTILGHTPKGFAHLKDTVIQLLVSLSKLPLHGGRVEDILPALERTLPVGTSIGFVRSLAQGRTSWLAQKAVKPAAPAVSQRLPLDHMPGFSWEASSVTPQALQAGGHIVFCVHA